MRHVEHHDACGYLCAPNAVSVVIKLPSDGRAGARSAREKASCSSKSYTLAADAAGALSAEVASEGAPSTAAEDAESSDDEAVAVVAAAAELALLAGAHVAPGKHAGG